MIEGHKANTKGRDFFVGDIHGQLRLLEEALAQVGFDKTCDRLFCVGDLIDRGVDSFDCLSLPFEPWFYGVRGNHEMLAYDALTGKSSTDQWMVNGGTWALSENRATVKQVLGEALRYLPYAREIEVAGKHIGMVHAEPPGDWSLLEAAGRACRQQLVWGRSRIRSQDQTRVAGIDAVVVGHTIVDEPVWLGNVLYIDTGAFCSGKLALIDAHDVLAWQQGGSTDGEGTTDLAATLAAPLAGPGRGSPQATAARRQSRVDHEGLEQKVLIRWLYGEQQRGTEVARLTRIPSTFPMVAYVAVKQRGSLRLRE